AEEGGQSVVKLAIIVTYLSRILPSLVTKLAKLFEPENLSLRDKGDKLPLLLVSLRAFLRRSPSTKGENAPSAHRQKGKARPLVRNRTARPPKRGVVSESM